jgi:DNA-binding MarR family transcriptional regulator
MNSTPTPQTAATPDIRAFRAALRLLVRKIGRQLRDDTQCCGVGFLPCHALLELEGAGGRSLRELQAAMETDKAALSRTVDCLVQDGLVTRKENPDDRRAVVIALTAAGRRKAATINRYSDAKYRQLFGLIPAREHATVVCAVGYLARAFDELGGEAVYCAPAKRRKS